MELRPRDPTGTDLLELHTMYCTSHGLRSSRGDNQLSQQIISSLYSNDDSGPRWLTHVLSPWETSMTKAVVMYLLLF
jgi:hypothetical protein